MARTSLTHPLRIDDLEVGTGRLGLTICPGKKGDSVFGAPWDRDLGLDLDAVRAWGADVVVTLVESDELAALGAAGLGQAVRARGMVWRHLPIRDLGAPDDRGVASWREVSPELHRALDAGGRVLIHCRGGLGRAGTMSALLLIERGDTAQEAIARVREARPHAIETSAQIEFLERMAALPDERAAMVRASLFGGAIGDTLGAEIEFWPLDKILRRFPNGVDEILTHDGRVGAITDDTQMTLFTAEGLVRAHERGRRSISEGAVAIVHEALLRWYATQGGRPRIAVGRDGLVEDRRLQRRRAPGNTCLSALGGG